MNVKTHKNKVVPGGAPRRAARPPPCGKERKGKGNLQLLITILLYSGNPGKMNI
jgi:hypothetical protein